MKRLCALVVLALAAYLAPPAQAQKKEAETGKKYAFLVACSDYTSGEFRKLPGTFKELKEFRRTLIDSGWPADNVYFLAFYTYDDNGAPEWYIAIGPVVDGVFAPAQVRRRTKGVTRRDRSRKTEGRGADQPSRVVSRPAVSA